MASAELSVSAVHNLFTESTPRSLGKKEMKRLRNAGMEYVSRSGKVVPAKLQSDVLCQCPQRCGDKVPQDVRNNLFAQFYKLADHDLQNDFLQAHIETLAVKRKRDRSKLNDATPGRSQRRVSCRYLIPLLANPAVVVKPGPNPGTRTIEVCQKAFMHVFAITEKRIRLQREKLIARAKADRQQDEQDADLFTGEQIRTIAMRRETRFPIDFEVFRTELDRDMAIVNNFFINQLWKPEYIDV